MSNHHFHPLASNHTSWQRLVGISIRALLRFILPGAVSLFLLSCGGGKEEKANTSTQPVAEDQAEAPEDREISDSEYPHRFLSFETKSLQDFSLLLVKLRSTGPMVPCLRKDMSLRRFYWDTYHIAIADMDDETRFNLLFDRIGALVGESDLGELPDAPISTLHDAVSYTTRNMEWAEVVEKALQRSLKTRIPPYLFLELAWPISEDGQRSKEELELTPVLRDLWLQLFAVASKFGEDKFGYDWQLCPERTVDSFFDFVDSNPLGAGPNAAPGHNPADRCQPPRPGMAAQRDSEIAAQGGKTNEQPRSAGLSRDIGRTALLQPPDPNLSGLVVQRISDRHRRGGTLVEHLPLRHAAMGSAQIRVPARSGNVRTGGNQQHLRRSSLR